MRAALVAVALLFAAGCAGDGARDDSTSSAADAPLSADLFPFDASPATFVDGKGAALGAMRVEPSPAGDACRAVFENQGRVVGEMRVVRRDGSLFFSMDAGEGVELIRGGARPGAAWESGGGRVRFEGWERATTTGPAAARIVVRRGQPSLEVTETWWFGPGRGLVRQRTDRGSLMVNERIRTSP